MSGSPIATRDRFRGCLLGGAVGDALGAPVEFWSLSEIRRRMGPRGVTGFADEGGQFTDDTQMTLFTAEGLIRAWVRGRSKGICHPPSVVHHAYLRWLHTQGVPWSEAGVHFGQPQPDGWLVRERHLHQHRGPGSTCLAMPRSHDFGSPERRLNESKGCGAVMRAAPVGLIADDYRQAFRLGCEVGALSHGHPSGWLPAGVLAAVVSLLVAGRDLLDSAVQARALALDCDDHAETVRALDSAIDLGLQGLPSAEMIERLGGGWVGEEALAIAVCCALAASDFSTGVLTAVNHSGDSDSTGSICGNLLGAAHGTGAIPADWIENLEACAIVTQIAEDLWTERFQPPIADEWGGPPPDWWERYPGW